MFAECILLYEFAVEADSFKVDAVGLYVDV